jgi:uncharacterized protein (TIGR02246 family)
MPDFDEKAVAAEIRSAFDAYEAALQANDVAALTGFFWEDARAIRLAGDGGLYGYEAIASFRRARDAADVARELLRVDVTVLGPDIGVATAEYRRLGSGGVGRSCRSGCSARRAGASSPRM